MSSQFEKPIVEALEAKEIEAAVILSRHTSGQQYERYLGNRTLLDGSTKPVAPDDILFLASCTKLLASIAALQLVDRGLLTLKTDLSAADYLPELTKHGVITAFDAESGSFSTAPVENAPTLVHLLTHSSGNSYRFMDPTIERWQQAHPAPVPAPSVPARMAHPLAYQPGHGWMYGTGLDWAGCLVERVSGLTLEEYLYQNVLEPLGIKEPRKALSFFPIKNGLGERMVDVKPGDEKGEGKSVVGMMSPHDGSESVCYGGHGGYMTAPAYLEVLYSILKNDGKLLKEETVELMFQPHLEPGAKESFESTLNGPAGVFFKNNSTGKGLDYGLGGLLITAEQDEGLGEGSLTWGGGITQAWFIDRKNGTCGFFAPMFPIPPDAQKGLTLKGHFRREMTKALLAEGNN